VKSRMMVFGLGGRGMRAAEVYADRGDEEEYCERANTA